MLRLGKGGVCVKLPAVRGNPKMASKRWMTVGPLPELSLELQTKLEALPSVRLKAGKLLDHLAESGARLGLRR